MRAYIIRRVLLLIPTFLLLSILVFLSVRFLPGDAIDALAAQMASFMDPDLDREMLERMLGLDQPIYVQYGRWVGGIFLHGTLGDSLLGDWRVEEKILARLPATLELGVMAIVIGLLIGLPVGIYSAMRRNTAADYVGRSAAIIGLATPNFWLATLIVTFPAIWWAWSPPLTPIIVIFSITIGGIIVAEASLSFLGFGLPPGVPSWGGMLSREGRQYMEMAPRLAIWPGLCLTVVVYSINMFGDALRDLLDPRLRGSVGRV